ncbi:MAG TPA: hypothetical protein VN771_04645 [Candidatus Baltobacteraceae bacterium]|nr:hypothetical protein [Candidatus Baltobacteraceae bacterium]
MLSRIVAVTLMLACVTGLGVGAVRGIRATAAQADPTEVSAWRLDLAYYDCLSAQVHSLVHRGQTVDVSMTDPGPGVTLAKVVAPFAVITAHPSGHVVLTLVTRRGPDTCLGSVVVARDPSGAVHDGRGSLGGRRMPPQTPL